MKTEDVQLDIKPIFDRKKISYIPADVARMRYLCTLFVENILELNRIRKDEIKDNGEMEKGNMWGQADGNR